MRDISSNGIRENYSSGFRYIGILLILLILGVSIILIISTNLGSSLAINETFGAQEQFLIDTSSYSTASFQTTEGSVSLYFFNNKPSITGFTTSSTSYYPLVISSNSYQYVENYFPTGSIIHISWSASSFVVFNIIIGSTNFNKWKNGNTNVVKYLHLGDSGNSIYTLSGKNDEIYFLFNLSGFTVNVNFNFYYQTPVYDITHANSHINSANFQDKSINSNYVLLVNEGFSSVSFNMQMNKKLSPIEIFFIMAIVYAGFMIWISRKLSRKMNQNKIGIFHQNASIKQPNIPEVSDIYGSYATSGQVNQPAKPMNQSVYIQKPQTKYCRSCGSEILQDALYCAECGSKV